ncbi:hypothetical protein PPBDW_I21082 [Photobacterium kishitanii]|nr:hypothetical protein PPBDW_I21082 [Photobacterium kishitanii]
MLKQHLINIPPRQLNSKSLTALHITLPGSYTKNHKKYI